MVVLFGCQVDETSSSNGNEAASGNDTASGDASNSGSGSDAGSDSGSSSSAEAHCDTDVLCETWLNKHNDLRQSFNSGGIADDGTNGNYPLPGNALPNLTWNPTLAKVAQSHADKCVYEHNGNRSDDYERAGGENVYIGENIAAHWFSSPAGDAAYYARLQMQLWWDEHTLWHYQPINSSNISDSGHFTQMIWANTVEIGCGMARCQNFNGTSFEGYFGVCNYGPGGNYLNQYPYQVN